MGVAGYSENMADPITLDKLETAMDSPPSPGFVNRRATLISTRAQPSQKTIDEVGSYKARLEELGNHKSSGHCNPVLDPNSALMRNYDMVVLVALIYTTLVTPYEVAILRTALNTRFFVNWAVDFIYILDMLRSFFTAYEDKNSVLVKNHRLIVKNYLHSWFIIDFVSIIPFDTLTLVIGDAFAKVKAIKVIRLLRLLKLAKIFRSFALYDKYKAQLAIPLNVVSLFQNCVKMCIASHWFACVWIMCATMQCDLDCMEEDDGPGADTPSWLQQVQQSEDTIFGPYEIYQAGVYWAIATITSVGYGDITATNTTERLVASFCLMLGGLLWASIIGDICGIIATLDVNGIEFRQVYDQVNTMLLELNAPFEHQVKVRTYFFKAEELRRTNRFKELLLELPPALRGVIGSRMVQAMLDGMKRPGLHYTIPDGYEGESICASLAMRIKNECYTPMETFGQERCLFVLSKGITLKMGFVVLRGGVWGQDLLIKHPFLREPHRVVAFSHVIVQRLSLTDLQEVLDPFPDQWAKITSQAARMSVIKCVVLAARKLRLGEEGSQTSFRASGTFTYFSQQSTETVSLISAREHPGMRALWDTQSQGGGAATSAMAQLELVSARQEGMHRAMEAQSKATAMQLHALDQKLNAVLQRLPMPAKTAV